jgi:AAHS family 4-hydroxybenzoate transporter-like MFS transporter
MAQPSPATAPASASGAVDIAGFIDAQPIGRFQLGIIILCALTVMLDGFDAQAIGYVAPAISREWQLKPGALGPVFGWGLGGLMLGALIFGPLADRVGRRPVIVFCTAFFGLFSLLTPLAGSLDGLLVYRFLTGLGLGGAMPNAIALTGEYAPQRSRATMIIVMFCGFSIGSALGGYLAAELIGPFGWRAVFYLGGAAPLLYAPVLLALLPESARLLALRGGADSRIAAILRRIRPDAAGKAAPTRFVVAEPAPEGVPVKHLFTEGRALMTALLWVMYFMNLLDLYFMANWLPTVIHDRGFSISQAALITTLLQIGGIVGGLTIGRTIDRRAGSHRILAFAYAGAGLFVALIGSMGALWAIAATVFGAGFFVVGAQHGANAFTAGAYPTQARAAGVGWALGIGRIGSIIGPVIGGVLLAEHWPTSIIFLIGAVPVLIASAAALCLGGARRHVAGLAVAAPVARPL